MKQPINLHEGMIVHSADGANLGKVVSCRADGFIIEKGVFLPKATQFQYDDIADQRGDDVYLAHGRAQLTDANWWSKREQAISALKSRAGANEPTPIGSKIQAAVESARHAVAPSKDADEIRVPLAEEEISAEKHTRDIGEVRVHKRVVVGHKQITVPVMHEEIHVERVAVSPTAGKPLGEGTFVESTMAIPLHDEEVEIRKRAVVREEVRVTKQTFQEEKTMTAEVRKEEVDIEEPKGFTRHPHAPTA